MHNIYIHCICTAPFIWQHSIFSLPFLLYLCSSPAIVKNDTCATTANFALPHATYLLLYSSLEPYPAVIYPSWCGTAPSFYSYTILQLTVYNLTCFLFPIHIRHSICVVVACTRLWQQAELLLDWHTHHGRHFSGEGRRTIPGCYSNRQRTW